MEEPDYQQGVLIAAALAALEPDSPGFQPWIRRDMESVRYLDRNLIERTVSRHYEIPNILVNVAEEAKASLPTMMLPVFDLPKGTYVSPSLIDETGKQVSLPPASTRTALTYSALAATALEILKRKPEEEILGRLHAVASPWPSAARLAYGQLSDATGDYDGVGQARALRQDPAFMRLLKTVQHRYFVYVPLPLRISQEERIAGRILSYKLEQKPTETKTEMTPPEFGWVGHLYYRLYRVRQYFHAVLWSIEVPDDFPARRRALKLERLLGIQPTRLGLSFTHSATRHIRFQAPDGLDLGDRSVRLGSTQIRTTCRGASRRSARIVMASDRSSPAPPEGSVWFDLHAGEGVLRWGGAGASFLLAALLASFATLDADSTGAAAPLLVSAVGLISLIASRPGEHSAVTGVVVGVRLLTLALIPVAFLGAAFLVLSLCEPLTSVVLMSLASFAAILGIALRWRARRDAINTRPDVERNIPGLVRIS